MEIVRVRTVVLAGGRSQRMGYDKLTALFDGEPLARRVARGLLELEPLFVATPAVAAVVSDLSGVRLVVTEPTAGPSATLALAHAAILPEAYLAVLPCDLPFLDAPRIVEFVGLVSDDADLAWPNVRGTPGHPVVWSPNARARIPALREHGQPSDVRRDAGLVVAALTCDDEAYVADVDTPAAWRAAEKKAANERVAARTGRRRR